MAPIPTPAFKFTAAFVPVAEEEVEVPLEVPLELGVLVAVPEADALDELEDEDEDEDPPPVVVPFDTLSGEIFAAAFPEFWIYFSTVFPLDPRRR